MAPAAYAEMTVDDAMLVKLLLHNCDALSVVPMKLPSSLKRS